MNRLRHVEDPYDDQNSANITICDHMYDETQTLVEYLYDEGKCGSICRGGRFNYFQSFKLISVTPNVTFYFGSINTLSIS